MKVLNRLKKNIEFNKVISEGELVKSDTIALHFLKNDLDHTRIGISIPRKSGKAVVRNKMKRQIRAIIASDADLNKGFDVVMIARKSYDISKFEKTRSDIDYLFEKVGLKA